MKEALEIQGLDALLVAGRRLLEINPDAFAKVLAAARAFVTIFDRPEESDDVFASRLREIGPRGPRLLD